SALEAEPMRRRRQLRSRSVRARSWTIEQLAEAVRASTTYSQVLRRLGSRPAPRWRTCPVIRRDPGCRIRLQHVLVEAAALRLAPEAPLLRRVWMGAGEPRRETALGTRSRKWRSKG